MDENRKVNVETIRELAKNRNFTERFIFNTGEELPLPTHLSVGDIVGIKRVSDTYYMAKILERCACGECENQSQVNQKENGRISVESLDTAFGKQLGLKQDDVGFSGKLKYPTSNQAPTNGPYDILSIYLCYRGNDSYWAAQTKRYYFIINTKSECSPDYHVDEITTLDSDMMDKLISITGSTRSYFLKELIRPGSENRSLIDIAGNIIYPPTKEELQKVIFEYVKREFI